MSIWNRPDRCICGQIVYEPGCGFGHLDPGLCEACEREAEEIEREQLNEAHLLWPDKDLTMEEALDLDFAKLVAMGAFDEEPA